MTWFIAAQLSIAATLQDPPSHPRLDPSRTTIPGEIQLLFIFVESRYF